MAAPPGQLLLANNNNCCYANVCIQLLTHAPNILQGTTDICKYMNALHSFKAQGYERVVDAMADINKWLAPQSQHRGRQGDPMEMLNAMFHAVRNDPGLLNQFCARDEQRIHCLKSGCGYSSVKQHVDLFYSVAIPDPKLDMYTLDQFYMSLYADEIISEYQCDDCRAKTPGCTSEAKRTLRNSATFPPYLLFHINRVSLEAKLNTKFVFPTRFRFFKHQEVEYQLLFIVIHSGAMHSRQGGHYYGFGLLPNGTFMCYNDTSCNVRDTNPALDDHVQRNVYMLLYKKM
jgi:ubiquitin C-terminal hydrolase